MSERRHEAADIPAQLVEAGFGMFAYEFDYIEHCEPAAEFEERHIGALALSLQHGETGARGTLLIAKPARLHEPYRGSFFDPANRPKVFSISLDSLRTSLGEGGVYAAPNGTVRICHLAGYTDMRGDFYPNRSPQRSVAY